MLGRRESDGDGAAQGGGGRASHRQAGPQSAGRCRGRRAHEAGRVSAAVAAGSCSQLSAAGLAA